MSMKTLNFADAPSESPRWDYFFEAPNGDVLADAYNVPRENAQALQNEKTLEIDGIDYNGRWHPYLP